MEFGILAIIAFQCMRRKDIVETYIRIHMYIVQQSIAIFVYLAFAQLGQFAVCLVSVSVKFKDNYRCANGRIVTVILFHQRFLLRNLFASQPESRQHNLMTLLPLVKDDSIIETVTVLHKAYRNQKTILHMYILYKYIFLFGTTVSADLVSELFAAPKQAAATVEYSLGYHIYSCSAYSKRMRRFGFRFI